MFPGTWLALLLWAALDARTAAGSVVSSPLALVNVFTVEYKQIAPLLKKMQKDPKVEELSMETKHLLDYYLFNFGMVEKELSRAGMFSMSFNDLVMDRLVSNMVHVYALIKRLVRDIFRVRKAINLQTEKTRDQKKFLTTLEEWTSLGIWPTDEDFTIAALSIARVQQAYQLDPYEMSLGRIGERQTNAFLGVEEVYGVAEARIERKERGPIGEPEYATAIEWIEAALKICEEYAKEDGQYGSWMKFLKGTLLKLRKDHDESMGWLKPFGPSLYPNEEFFKKPIGEDLSVTARHLREEEAAALSHVRTPPPKARDPSTDQERFFALCRGETIKVDGIENDKPQQCYLDNLGDPFLILQPVKKEVLMEDPVVVYQFHDLIREDDIEYFKDSATELFTTAQVFDVKSSDNEFGVEQQDFVSPVRIQSVAWLFNDVHPRMSRIDRLLDHVTGLQISALNASSTAFVEAEEFQVGLYGPGGLYLVHNDALGFKKDADEIARRNPENEVVGDRIATLMIYLSEPDGGRTAFPKLGIAARPVKGSAVFWYNMLPSGDISQLSAHGGCPVLYGAKWVSNKWIRSDSQMFKRPCDLNQSAMAFEFHKTKKKKANK